MVDCIFKQAVNGYQCQNCGVIKRKATRRNCGLKKGLGDTVARVTKAAGVKPCGGCNKRRAKLNNLKPTPAYRDARLVYTADLVADAMTLAEQVPHYIDGICGVPRSGMIPASVIATHLHLPLFTLNNRYITEVGKGQRLRASESKSILIVDDTVMNGNTLNRLESFKCSTAAVYVNPHAKRKPELFAKELEPPHLLEWNLFNSGYLARMAFDMDGVICHDQPFEQWYTVPARLRYLPRKEPITIITARLEKDRQLTLDWLAGHDVTVNELIMFDGSASDRANQGVVSNYKAKAFAATGKDWFVESCQQQAQEIAELTGAWVICTENGRVY